MKRSLLKNKGQLSNKLRGQSAVELMFIIPLLAVFLAATFEFSSLYYFNLKLDNITREAANAAFRDCQGLADPKAMKDCLTPIVNELAEKSSYVLTHFSEQPSNQGEPYKHKLGDLLISAFIADEPIIGDPIFSCNPPTPSPPAKLVATVKMVDSTHNINAKYGPPLDLTQFQPLTNHFVAQKGGFIFIAEAWYNYRELLNSNGSSFLEGLTSAVNEMFGWNLDATIFPTEIYSTVFF